MEKASPPFVAGVILGAFAGAAAARSFAGLSLILCHAAIFTICAGKGGRGMFPALFFLLGLFCSLSASMLPSGTGRIPGFAERAAAIFKESIDAIPFEDRRCNALIRALLTGDRSGLDRNTVSAFRGSGASHILALSGFHLGFIYLAVRKITAIFGNSPAMRTARSIAVMLFSVFYTIMTGASPSTCRACIFIILKELSDVGGQRRSTGAGAFHTALILQLAFSPMQIKSASFQLSYLAMAGILYVNPILSKWLPERQLGWNPVRKIWESASMSISCQIFTAPVAWYYFGTFPKYFLLTNLISLPLTSAIMALSVATTAICAAGLRPMLLIKANGKAIELLISALDTISGM